MVSLRNCKLYLTLFIAFLFISFTSCENKANFTPKIIKTSAGKEMVQIPSGWFEMGSKKGRDNELPVHKVWVDCNDKYCESYYSNSPEKNPQGPDKGKKYILKGGSWNSSDDSCRSSYRVGEDPGFQDACFSRDDIGFRCVRIASKITSLNTGNLNFQLISLNPPNPRICKDEGGRMKDERENSTISPFSKGGKGDLKGTQNQKSSKLKTGFVYDDIYLKHKTGPRHPEKPQRLTAIVSSLEKYLSDENSKLQLIPPKSFSDTVDWLTTIHSPEYIERVKKSCQNKEEYMDSIDTPISPESYEVAVMAVGGVLSAIDGVMNGKIKNAFCAVRPPGHHSLRDKAMGFCIFNNIAISAKYIQKKYNLSKVLIVDWDVHHGNGTQDAFYNDPTVLYFSAHRSPFYPGTGYADEKGVGKGLNYTINVEMTAGNGDIDYKRVFESILKPRALEFDPDFVLISAGFDAHKDDPLGGMNITANGYAEITKIVKDIAEKCCDGRLVSVLEGGYSLEGLAESVDAHVSVLMN